MGNYIKSPIGTSIRGIDFKNQMIETLESSSGKIVEHSFKHKNIRIEKVIGYPMPEKLCFGLYLDKKGADGKPISFIDIVLDIKPNQIPEDWFEREEAKNITINPQAYYGIYPNSVVKLPTKEQLLELLTTMLISYEDRMKIMTHIRKNSLKNKYYEILREARKTNKRVNDLDAKKSIINGLNNKYGNIFVWDEPVESEGVNEHEIGDVTVVARNNVSRYVTGETFGVGIDCRNRASLFDFISKYKYDNGMEE